MKIVKFVHTTLAGLFSFCLFVFLPLSVQGQPECVVRGDCTPGLNGEGSVATRGLPRKLPSLKKNWDPSKTYKQMVILVSFRDKDFLMENPRATYDSIFNFNGYNQRNGKGCIADYFRDQSGGRCNFKFDIYGPMKVDTLAQPVAKPTENTRNYGSSQFVEATRKTLEAYPDVDYRQYDWDNDGYVDQVIYIYAGTCGNQGSESYGYIWPNTSSFTAVKTPDGLRISNYTASAEVWSSNLSCGIGTICHEFSHSFGLPDIYPTTTGAGYSVVDEWDLMDGGNFTNYGWCPPNYTPIEKILLGWLDPIDLDDPVSISGMRPSEENGPVYRIKHTANEWYLLENRQQRGWDYGVPGKGLVIYHVYYDKSIWSGNTVNNNRNKRRFELVHADNMDYDAWATIIGRKNPYTESPRLRNRHLSTSPYPWKTDSTEFVNKELTDSSVPPAKMLYSNESGSLLLSKSITNIRMSDDGLISFDFRGGDPVGVRDMKADIIPDNEWYNMQGQRVTMPRKGVFVRKGKKYFKH